jgi:cytochrome c-type biogenesis protein CcmE
MERNRRFIVGVAVIVAAVTYLVYTGVRETSVYYLTIDEFLSRRDALANEGIRVAGRVGAGSVQWNPSTLDLRFRLRFPLHGAAQQRPVVAAHALSA